MSAILEIENVKSWTEGVPVEPDAINQLRKLAQLPVLGGHVAVMPDVHLGIGATVGSVIPTRGAVIPSAVGVDIGCGMLAAQISITASQLPSSVATIRAQIERDVPVGTEMHREPANAGRDPSAHRLEMRLRSLRSRYGELRILDRLGRYNHQRVWRQLGTLGGGNHFIELCLDEDEGVWVMLHSGSRNIGSTIGQTAISAARERALRENIHLPDRDLAWLDEGSAAFADYVEALNWAQEYAALNRDLMLARVLHAVARAMGRKIDLLTEVVNCHHNYASLEQHFGERLWITRKGAVSARAGELGIVPGSMGARSFIVRGKGNPDSYCSCSHGAGRRMSRGEAKRRFTQQNLKEQTRGIECRKDVGVLDEIPAAYKDIEEVMRAQADLVEVVHTLKQLMCVKG